MYFDFCQIRKKYGKATSYLTKTYGDTINLDNTVGVKHERLCTDTFPLERWLTL